MEFGWDPYGWYSLLSLHRKTTTIDILCDSHLAPSNTDMINSQVASRRTRLKYHINPLRQAVRRIQAIRTPVQVVKVADPLVLVLRRSIGFEGCLSGIRRARSCLSRDDRKCLILPLPKVHLMSD